MAERSSGSALTAVMLLIAVLCPLAAYVSMQARLDVSIGRAGRSALEAFYVAESGLEHALADLAREPAFERLQRGPDGKRGTADDHLFPFSAPPPAFFPQPPAAYRVETAENGAERVDVISYGRSLERAARAVAVTVIRSDLPYIPAAIYCDGDGLRLELGDDVHVHGSEDGEEDDAPAVALDEEADVDVFIAELPAATRERLHGPGGEPSAVERRFRSLGAMSTALAGLTAAEVFAGDLRGPFGPGIRVSMGSVQAADTQGSGVLIVDGDLSIAGRFEFTGLVIVRGKVESDPDSWLDVDGALLLEEPGGELRLLGGGEIRYDLDAIALADGVAPDVLPHRAIVGGWREHFE
jgi:hypothetical protein